MYKIKNIVKNNFDKSFFKNNPYKIIKGLIYIFTILTLIIIILVLDNNYFFLKILLSLILGRVIGAHALFVHEVMHGAIIKNKKIQDLYCLIFYASYHITPTYWRYWHNYLHHGYTQNHKKDPDVLPPIEIRKKFIQKNKYFKFVNKLLPQSYTFLSLFYCFYWMNIQSQVGQLYLRFKKNGNWDKINNKRINIEYFIQLALIVGYIYFIGLKEPITLIIIPFILQNYTVMSYIVTNHTLEPISEKNNPFKNSRNLIINPFFEKLDFHFNYHIEHHLFPNLEGSKLKKINNYIKEQKIIDYNESKKNEALMEIFINKK